MQRSPGSSSTLLAIVLAAFCASAHASGVGDGVEDAARSCRMFRYATDEETQRCIADAMARDRTAWRARSNAWGAQNDLTTRERERVQTLLQQSRPDLQRTDPGLASLVEGAGGSVYTPPGQPACVWIQRGASARRECY